MRDGIYLYLPNEIGITDRDPHAPIKVFRPQTEIKKAYDRFLQIGKLPIVVNHPNEFLNLSSQTSYQDGFATNPTISFKDSYNVIDCDVEITGQSLLDYESGTRQLSCGWEGDFEKAQEGSPYEFIQTFKDINHIAMVEIGRCGNTCKINDGGLTMPKLGKIIPEILSKLGVASEIDSEKLKAILAEYETVSEEDDKIKKDDDDDLIKKDDESTEKKEPEKKEVEIEKEVEVEKKEPEKEDADVDPDVETEKGEPFHVEMDTEKLVKLLEFAGIDLETAKSKVSEYLGKMKDDDKTKDECDKTKVMDKAFNDAFEKGKKAQKDLMLKRFADVMPVIRSSEFKTSDFVGKTPCQIKALFVEKVAGTKIKDSDAGLDAVFDMVLKNHENPAWKHIKDSGTQKISEQISAIRFKKED